MEPGCLLEGEFDRMPPHFAMTQRPGADWSAYKETQWANHGLGCHRADPDQLRRDMAIYYGMISFMDHQIGRTLDRLDELGIADETLVVFTTDHGHFLGQHGLTAKGPFHYEDLLRVPFVVRCPGRVPAGRTSAALQCLVDLPATFLRAAAAEVPDTMQGVDQLDVWCGATSSARDEVLVEFRHQPTKVHLRTYIDDRYKMTIYRDQSYGELFDLLADPEERQNRWDAPEHQSLKADVMLRFLNAELRREPLHQPRVAHA
jgi:arylsulfatase A-like enzyme